MEKFKVNIDGVLKEKSLASVVNTYERLFPNGSYFDKSQHDPALELVTVGDVRKALISKFNLDIAKGTHLPSKFNDRGGSSHPMLGWKTGGRSNKVSALWDIIYAASLNNRMLMPLGYNDSWGAWIQQSEEGRANLLYEYFNKALYTMGQSCSKDQLKAVVGIIGGETTFQCRLYLDEADFGFNTKNVDKNRRRDLPNGSFVTGQIGFGLAQWIMSNMLRHFVVAYSYYTSLHGRNIDDMPFCVLEGLSGQVWHLSLLLTLKRADTKDSYVSRTRTKDIMGCTLDLLRNIQVYPTRVAKNRVNIVNKYIK